MQDEPDLGEAVIAVEVKGPSICCGYPMERIVNTLFTTIKTAAEVMVVILLDLKPHTEPLTVTEAGRDLTLVMTLRSRPMC